MLELQNFYFGDLYPGFPALDFPCFCCGGWQRRNGSCRQPVVYGPAGNLHNRDGAFPVQLFPWGAGVFRTYRRIVVFCVSRDIGRDMGAGRGIWILEPAGLPYMDCLCFGSHRLLAALSSGISSLCDVHRGGKRKKSEDVRNRGCGDLRAGTGRVRGICHNRDYP